MKIPKKVLKYIKLIPLVIILMIGCYFYFTRNTGKIALEKAKTESAKKNAADNQKIDESLNGKETAILGSDNEKQPEGVTAGPDKSLKSEEVMTPQELEEYHALYKELDVMLLRKMFDNYRNGSKVGIAPNAIEKGVYSTGDTMGLDSFDKDYYKSKFIILLRTDGSTDYNEGKLINLIFVDKPDKVFQAWVLTSGEGANLWGFLHLKTYDETAIAEIRTKYKSFFEDTQYMM